MKLIPLIFIIFIVIDAYTLPCRVELIPNGDKFSCLNCHIDAGGKRNLFGKSVEAIVKPGSCDPFWGQELAHLDSDKDGISNGAELQDPQGIWTPGIFTERDYDLLTNPGVSDSMEKSFQFDNKNISSNEQTEKSSKTFSIIKLIEPLGIAALTFLLLTACAGFFMRKNPKVLFKSHKILAITTLIIALCHAIIVFFFF